MKKIIAVVIILIIVVGVVLLIRGNEDTWICSSGSWVKHGHPTASMPTKPCVATSNQNQAANPSANIQLLSPKAGSALDSQFVISGKAKVFENQLNFRVRNANGQALIEGTMLAKAQNVGQFGPFEATVSSLPKGKTIIEVFDKSAKDGLEIDKVSVEITIK